MKPKGNLRCVAHTSNTNKSDKGSKLYRIVAYFGSPFTFAFAILFPFHSSPSHSQLRFHFMPPLLTLKYLWSAVSKSETELLFNLGFSLLSSQGVCACECVLVCIKGVSVSSIGCHVDFASILTFYYQVAFLCYVEIRLSVSPLHLLLSDEQTL